MTRQVEDRLSDALHERLAARFVDRRTSLLMRRLRENVMLEAEVAAAGDVLVEGQHVGTLSGFQFLPDAKASGPEARALNAAAIRALVGELEARAARLSLAGDEAFVLANDGLVRWQGEPVARLAAGEKLLAPKLRVLADDHLSAAAREQVEQRLGLWLKAHVTKHLGPLLVLEDAPELVGMARGIAFQLAEALGVLDRAKVAQDVKTLDQEARAALRKHGVRFGAYHVYLPQLLKPAPRALATQLWSLSQADLDPKARDDIAHLTHSGRTSIPADKGAPKELYRVAGFRVAGERALRVDILERLADLIRPAAAYRPGVTPGEPPPGAADGDGFVVTGAMTSLVGASGPDFAGVLKALGYQMETRPGPAITVPLARPTPAAQPAEADAARFGRRDGDGQRRRDGRRRGRPSPGSRARRARGRRSRDCRDRDVGGCGCGRTRRAGAVTADSPDETPSGTPSGPAAIEVWRAVRHGHGRRPEQRQGRGRERGRRPASGEAAPGAGAEARPEERGRGRRPDERGQRPRQAEGEAGRPPQGKPGRPFRRDDRDKRREGEREERPRQGRGENRRGDDRRGREERFDRSLLREDRAPRSREPDPNSPFAKLAALKARLEGGG